MSHSVQDVYQTGGTQASYAHTAMRNVSPIRSHIPGQSNTPMTYTGPPSQQEINRNRGRRDYSRSSFDFGFEGQPQMPGGEA